MKRSIFLFVFLCAFTWLKAQDKNAGESTNYLLYGGIAVATLVVLYLVYRFFKNTEEKKSDRVPVIKSVSPNPSSGPVIVQIEGNASLLKVFNKNGQQLGAFAIIGGSDTHLNLTSSPRGSYVVTAYYGGTASNSIEFTLE